MRSIGKALRYMVQRQELGSALIEGRQMPVYRWPRVRGFPRKWQAEAYIAEQPPGEQFRMVDLRTLSRSN